MPLAFIFAFGFWMSVAAPRGPLAVPADPGSDRVQTTEEAAPTESEVIESEGEQTATPGQDAPGEERDTNEPTDGSSDGNTGFDFDFWPDTDATDVPDDDD